MHLLQVKGIDKEYNSKPALKGVDFHLDSGTSLTLFGPNGAGKTTLLKIIAGIMSPSKGTLLYRGEELHRNRHSGERYYLGHNNSLYNSLTVQENMNFAARLSGRRNGVTVESLLRDHGFWERRHTVVRELSQGMKRRLAIIRGLLSDPALLILDEPFAGLDMQWRNSVREKILDMKKQGKSLILTTHLADEGHALADYIGFLHRGGIAFIRPRQELAAADIQALFQNPEKELEKWIS